MKTSQSFFPTRTHLKSREPHHEHTYQVVKVKELEQTPRRLSSEPVNIFRDSTNPPRKEELNKLFQRPVGGLELFKKIEQIGRDRPSTNRKLSKRSNKDKTQKNIPSSHGPRFKREPEDFSQVSPLKSILENKQFHKSQSLLPQECLKTHATYDPYASASSLRKTTFTAKSKINSQNNYRPVTSTAKRHDRWTADQRKQYQDKSALLNEISYTKPLVQLYGDRYFQYVLRNRFQDDFKPHPYVYILSNKNQPQSKTISKLRHYRPDIKQKQMMFLRGRKLKPEIEQM